MSWGPASTAYVTSDNSAISAGPRTGSQRQTATQRLTSRASRLLGTAVWTPGKGEVELCSTINIVTLTKLQQSIRFARWTMTYSRYVTDNVNDATVANSGLIQFCVIPGDFRTIPKSERKCLLGQGWSREGEESVQRKIKSKIMVCKAAKKPQKIRRLNQKWW